MRILIQILLLFIVLLIPAPSYGLRDEGALYCNAEIIQKPVISGKTRDDLSRQYISKHYGFSVKTPHIEPKLIVVHWTAMEGLDASYKAFRNIRLPGSRTELVRGGELNVGTHFLVDKEGAIYQLLPLPYFARHVIGLNYYSIGIENVGGTAGKLTPQQEEADEMLIRCLIDRYKGIRHVIGHYEYRELEGTPLFLEQDPKYRTEKTDPGRAFMHKIRSRLSDLYKESVLCSIKQNKEGKCLKTYQ